MKHLMPYRIISYILLVIAALLSFVCLFGLLMAFINPIVFFQVLIFACLITYIIASFIFFIRVVESGKSCKPKLIKIIRLTSLVSTAFSVLFLINGIFVLYNPSIISQFAGEFLSNQKQQPVQFSTDMIVSTLKFTIYFMILFATTLIIHVYETYKLLKQFKDAVAENKPDNSQQ